LQLQNERQVRGRRQQEHDDMECERHRVHEQMKLRKARIVFDRWSARRRFERYGDPILPTRSLKERWAAAEARTKGAELIIPQSYLLPT